ncbi:glycosyltransferase family 9 protein [Oxalobacteraceae bacterium OTU3CINTB1]|nr:glycosyltransferase family 9 protein [Oxalobacteraceae bacterium OTU3CINTB1]
MNTPLLQRIGEGPVAVFRALYLGDMLCAVPALRALRAALPQARIVLVGLPWAEQFSKRYSAYLDGFVAFPGHPDLPEQPALPYAQEDFYSYMREQEFALALQMHGSGEVTNGIVAAFGAGTQAGYGTVAKSPCGRKHALPFPQHGAEPLRLLRLARWLGADTMGCRLEFPLMPEDWEELEHTGAARGLPAGGYACIHAGARLRDKCWPPARFAEVADRLALEHGLKIVLTGSASEADLASAVAARMDTPAINATVPMSVGAMAALMSGARLLICNDTGVSHIAAGLGLRSVVIFSKADMGRWAPLNRRLHRCIRDPEGRKTQLVLAQARSLLAGARMADAAARRHWA